MNANIAQFCRCCLFEFCQKVPLGVFFRCVAPCSKGALNPSGNICSTPIANLKVGRRSGHPHCGENFRDVALRQMCGWMGAALMGRPRWRFVAIALRAVINRDVETQGNASPTIPQQQCDITNDHACSPTIMRGLWQVALVGVIKPSLLGGRPPNMAPSSRAATVGPRGAPAPRPPRLGMWKIDGRRDSSSPASV
jgi:hypothetical protein